MFSSAGKTRTHIGGRQLLGMKLREIHVSILRCFVFFKKQVDHSPAGIEKDKPHPYCETRKQKLSCDWQDECCYYKGRKRRLDDWPRARNYAQGEDAEYD